MPVAGTTSSVPIPRFSSGIFTSPVFRIMCSFFRYIILQKGDKERESLTGIGSYEVCFIVFRNLVSY